MEIDQTVNSIFLKLRSCTLPHSSERELQDAIEAVLAPIQREYRLGSGRIDFMLDGVGIEVKIHGSAKSIHRQLTRYCTFEDVKALILVTSKSMGLPPGINGKPIYYFSVGRSWL